MTVPSYLAGPPAGDVRVPELLRRALEPHSISVETLEPVWRNEAGELTFAVAERRGRAGVYAKWNPVWSGESLEDEARRMAWLQQRHPVPKVLDLVADGHGEVLITTALPGDSAVSERWRATPEVALRALGEGLRQLHSVPVEGCPYHWSAESRLAIAGVGCGSAALSSVPPVDRLVLCQGDPCAPNTLIGDDGSFLAHVDLARLGAADRWADLAVMSMSLAWNYSDVDETVFWEAYGVEPDEERIDYYRRLWNAE